MGAARASALAAECMTEVNWAIQMMSVNQAATITTEWTGGGALQAVGSMQSRLNMYLSSAFTFLFEVHTSYLINQTSV